MTPRPVTFTVTIWRDPPHDDSELDVAVALGEDPPDRATGILEWDVTLLNADHLSAAERDAALTAARRRVDGWGRG